MSDIRDLSIAELDAIGQITRRGLALGRDLEGDGDLGSLVGEARLDRIDRDGGGGVASGVVILTATTARSERQQKQRGQPDKRREGIRSGEHLLLSPDIEKESVKTPRVWL